MVVNIQADRKTYKKISEERTGKRERTDYKCKKEQTDYTYEKANNEKAKMLELYV